MSVYRWERDPESYDEDGGMVLHAINDRGEDEGCAALYWCATHGAEWDWVAYGPFREGECATADEARRACEEAVLHGVSA